MSGVSDQPRRDDGRVRPFPPDYSKISTKCYLTQRASLSYRPPMVSPWPHISARPESSCKGFIESFLLLQPPEVLISKPLYSYLTGHQDPCIFSILFFLHLADCHQVSDSQARPACRCQRLILNRAARAVICLRGYFNPLYSSAFLRQIHVLSAPLEPLHASAGPKQSGYSSLMRLPSQAYLCQWAFVACRYRLPG